jgi:GNAT superfamily N-acetyltransferase
VTNIEVQLVRGWRDVRHYIAAPQAVYHADSTWVPPLRHTIQRTMNPRHNPFHQEAVIDHFVARERGRAVGRVAAILQPAYIDRYGPRAFFGFFESVPDKRVAESLLSTVERWAAERGMTTLIGPCSYTTTQEIGLLVDGFDEPTALMQPYNPPYYADLLHACGYQPSFAMSTYTWRIGERTGAEDRLLVRGDEVMRHLGLRVRSGDLRRYDEELEGLRRIYNQSFANHPELVPISRPVFHAQAADLRWIIDPDLIRVVEHDGRPVGFAVLVPNLFDILRGCHGRITPRLALRLASRRNNHIEGIRSAVVVMIGAIPEYFGLGIGRILAAEIVKAGRAGNFDAIHTTWVHEQNRACRAIAQQMRSAPNKRYTVFEKSL